MDENRRVRFFFNGQYVATTYLPDLADTIGTVGTIAYTGDLYLLWNGEEWQHLRPVDERV